MKLPQIVCIETSSTIMKDRRIQDIPNRLFKRLLGCQGRPGFILVYFHLNSLMGQNLCLLGCQFYVYIQYIFAYSTHCCVHFNVICLQDRDNTCLPPMLWTKCGRRRERRSAGSVCPEAMSHSHLGGTKSMKDPKTTFLPAPVVRFASGIRLWQLGATLGHTCGLQFHTCSTVTDRINALYRVFCLVPEFNVTTYT